jgi:hypothetical protein
LLFLHSVPFCAFTVEKMMMITMNSNDGNWNKVFLYAWENIVESDYMPIDTSDMSSAYAASWEELLG